MFSVRPVCRLLIVSGAAVMLAVLNFIINDRVVMMLSAFAIVWLWLYLSHMKTEITSCYLIRYTGNIFKHKTIFLLKNVLYIQITVFKPWRPAVIRLYTPTGAMLVLGLDGRQAELIEKRMKTYAKY